MILKISTRTLRGTSITQETIDDFSAELHGFKYFTQMDAKLGYWIVQLDRDLILDNIQHALVKIDMVIAFILSVCQVSYLPGETTCRHQDVVGYYRHSRCALTKGDSEINHDMAVLSLPETVSNNNLKFDPEKIQFKTRECKLF